MLLIVRPLIIYHFKKPQTMSNFQLNFNSTKKVISITLDNEDGIFDLAYLFKKLLDDAGIANKLEEKEIEPVEAVEVETEKLN